MELVYIGRKKSIIVDTGKGMTRVLKGKEFECVPKHAATLQARFNLKGKEPLFLEAEKVKTYVEDRQEEIAKKIKARKEEDKKDAELRGEKPEEMSMEQKAILAKKEKAGKKALADKEKAEKAGKEL